MKRAAIILAGGESRRMGRPKATLPFGDKMLITQILATVEPLVERLFVVKAPNQMLPELQEVQIVEDRTPGQGPLEGIAAGLSAAIDFDAAFVGSCDTPLLVSGVVEHLFQELNNHEIVAIRTPEFIHPLCAVYRPSVKDRANQLLEQQKRRPRFLLDESQTKLVEAESLRHLDPNLDSLWNLNTPEDYEKAAAAVEVRSQKANRRSKSES